MTTEAYPKPAKPSRGEQWFRSLQISTDPSAFLKSLVSSSPPVFEDEWIEFKGADKFDDGRLKEIWAAALAGFANTAGGVLVWGIDARKDMTSGIDCAGNLALVANPAAHLSRLKELHAQACDPPVQGVEYFQCGDQTDKGAGFVVCYVPESRFKPHRAELRGKAFFIRVGDSFLQPGVALLRSMFYPHLYSWLWVEMAVTVYNRRQHEGTEVQIEARLHNSGTATAGDVFLVVQTDAPGSLEPALNWQTQGTPQGRSGFTCPAMPIHPGQVFPTFTFHQLVKRVEQIEFRILMYARDREPLETTMVFTSEQLEDKVTVKGVSDVGTWHRQV